MNIFKKKLNETEKKKLPINPVELFEALYPSEGYEYLRSIQEEVLEEWHSIRSQRDVLCKMNTGSGKTLVSLLMLYSKMNEGAGPSLYLCPDRQLLEQTKKQADLYGIPTCEVIEQEGYKNELPEDFLNSEGILLCTFQRLFNSKSIFERESISIGAIVIDDAHTCLNKAKSATTINVPDSHKLFERLLNLFENDLKKQGAGTFSRLIDGDPYARVLKVPYWSWLNKNHELINLIGEYHDNDILKFKWGLIADDLNSYECYLGHKGIEISPIRVPYYNISSFHNAKHRYILSATFEDQVSFVKDLGISSQSIKDALVPKNRKDVGQRLILAPKRFDPSLKESDVMSFVKSFSDEGYNVVVMVPSFERSEEWEEIGAHRITRDNINTELEKLKKHNGAFYTLVNRYDGVDLSGDMCRILVIDGYPSVQNLTQSYNELRLDSVKSSLRAQLIEQGLGRAVRSGSDYCIVLLMGSELLKFVGQKINQEYFTPATKKQLSMGLTLLEGEDNTNALKTLKETSDFCLAQSREWRQFHSSNLNSLSGADISKLNDQLDIASIEAKALDAFIKCNYKQASSLIISEIVDKYELDKRLKGWYFELAARLMYNEDPVKSNDLQLTASRTAPHMLQPQNGVSYSRLKTHERQAQNVLSYINNFEKSQDLVIDFQELSSDLSFGEDFPYDKFENALEQIGKLLGFNAHQPEKEFGNGPDVLWGMNDGHYLVLEAKSMATHSEITRENINQLLGSGEWFKNNYNSHNHTLVTVQSPQRKDKKVNINEQMRVMCQSNLDELKNNVDNFIRSLNSKGFKSIDTDELSKLLKFYSFTPEQFRNKYLSSIITN